MSKKNKLVPLKENNSDSYYSLSEKVDLSFKDKSIKKLYNETYENVIKVKIADLKIKIERPRNKKGLNDILIDEWKKHYDKINIYGIENPFPFKINLDVMRIYDMNKDLYYDEIILQLHPDTDSEKMKDIIVSIATLNALWDFHIPDGLRNDSVHNEVEDENIINSLKWIGDKSQFIQLIHALYESNILTNSEKEKTKLVQQIAQLFNVELGKNPNSLLTHYIKRHGKKSEIFELLKRTYEQYAQKIIDKTEEN